MDLPIDEILSRTCINIMIDIDYSLEKRIMTYRIDLETYTDEKSILKYIEKQKSRLRKMIKEVPLPNIEATNKYRTYLNQKPLNPLLRKKAIEDFLIHYRESLEQLKSGEIWFKIYPYNIEREKPNIKSIVEAATLLEYNSFLTNEIELIKQDNSKSVNSMQLDDKNIRLKWNGKKTELVELIKSLIEHGSIEGSGVELAEIFGNFFRIELNNFDQTVQKIANRSQGSETLFLDKLKTSFINYRNKTEQERRDASKKRKKNL